MMQPPRARLFNAIKIKQKTIAFDQEENAIAFILCKYQVGNKVCFHLRHVSLIDWR